MNRFDKNISNYTIAELLTILGLQSNDIYDINKILDNTNVYINKYINEENNQMVTFFTDMQNELIQYNVQLLQGEEPTINPDDIIQTNIWIENENYPQKDPIQKNKITDRSNQIDIFNNSQMPMKKTELGISNTFTVPVAQDKLNPNLENITSRFINIDSQFRQQSPNDTATDYTLDLSDPLTNVISLRLYSFQIPYTWYVIDGVKGNTCFWVQFMNNNNEDEINIPITVPSGNYTPQSFISVLNQSFIDAGFTFNNTTPINMPVTYNSNNAKIMMNLFGGVYNDVSGNQLFIMDETTKIIFYDPSIKLQCSIGCPDQSPYVNQTLGWLMGFRSFFVMIESNKNLIPPAVIDLNGPRYLIIVIDDYNQNHINNGLIGITELSKTLKLPNYYSPDLPYECSNGTWNVIPQLTPSAPRTLTRSQIYTINEIMKNNDDNENIYTRSPTSTDTFALIPVKSGLVLGSIYVELSGSLQDNKRIYFGPVNIDRLRVRLLDDKGNVLNLNGADWSITLISENLYQY